MNIFCCSATQSLLQSAGVPPFSVSLGNLSPPNVFLRGTFLPANDGDTEALNHVESGQAISVDCRGPTKQSGVDFMIASFSPKIEVAR